VCLRAGYGSGENEIATTMRDQKRTAILTDMESQARRAESEANGPLITHASNQIIQPTAFSSVT
jgi:hypothetical protein